ncbi:MAG: sodium-dependent transporter, partial [Lachnospiraceae bacterium]|nr:sodium-dependent transporter [Lachnospiraceae bacterium]
MSNEANNNDGWGSRIGYILSTLGMAVGVGAMWRFPMLCAQYGGGAFVLAFVVVTILAVIPAGWAESALGRKYKMSAVGVFGKLAGKKGTVFGYLMAATPLGLMFYYPIVMATVLIYIVYTFAGAPFLSDVSGFYEQVNNNRPVIYLCVVLIILATALISLRGIKKGVEKACKILLPVMFVFLIIIVIRVFTLPGIAEGIEFYVKPDWSQLANPSLWASAAGMALFAVGLGPGYLLTYGMYLDDKADLATDFLTVNVTQLLICVLCGFATIPAVILFGLDPLAGKGLIFMSLPMVFSELSGG